jgi:hypothetical protein
MILNSVMNAAIVELRGVGVPLADSLPIVLRKQIKLANSGGLGRRKYFCEDLLEYMTNTLHLLTRHVAISPFEEDIDVPAQYLDMKTNLTL